MKFDNILSFLGMSYLNKNTPQEKIEDKPETKNLDEGSVRPTGPKEVYLKWVSPSRTMFSQYSSKGKKTLAVIGVVFCVLLALMQEFVLIFAIVAVLYMTYALSKMQPETVDIEVSSHGIRYGQTDYSWNDLSRYFFTKEGTQEILAIDTYKRLPARLFLLIEEKDKVKADEVFSKHLTKLEKEPQTVIDSVYKKAVSKLNLENTK